MNCYVRHQHLGVFFFKNVMASGGLYSTIHINNSQSLIINFVHWTQLSEHWTHDTDSMLLNIRTTTCKVHLYLNLKWRLYRPSHHGWLHLGVSISWFFASFFSVCLQMRKQEENLQKCQKLDFDLVQIYNIHII